MAPITIARAGAFWLWLCIGLCGQSTFARADGPPPSTADVVTHHYDNARTGWYQYETALTPGAIQDRSFGLLYRSQQLDEQIDAQPLVIHGLTVGGAPKTVVFIATENNTLYALDASNGVIITSRSFGAPIPKDHICGNASEHLGINSTPVIDPQTQTLYLIAPLWSGTSFDYMLHAIDLTTLDDADPAKRLRDKIPSVKVTATGGLTDSTHYVFQPQLSRQRSALLLANGRVYAGFASFCDSNGDLSRGWLLGWDATTLAPIQPALLDHRPVSTVRSGRLDSIWMSGFGPAADAEGHIYVVTGNSSPPRAHETLPVVPGGPDTYLSDSVVRFDRDLKVQDFFTPSDPTYGQEYMDRGDHDLGSGGVLLIPEDVTTTSLPLRAAVAVGKTGQMYLLDRNKLGKFTSGHNNVLETDSVGRCFCGSSYFEGADGLPRVVSSGDTGLMIWQLTSTPQSSLQLKQEPLQAPGVPLGTDFFQKGFLTAVSSNRQTTGTALIWAIRRPQKGDNPQALTLHVFDADNGKHLCSLPAGPWPMNKINGAAPNTVPVIADGRVFVASYKELQVFGLGSPQACGSSQPVAAAHAAHLNPSEIETIQGKIVDVDVEGTKILHLQPPTGPVLEVDLLQVLANGRHGNIDKDKPVTIHGFTRAPGKFVAESIRSGD
jgi:hypothetical protein